MFAFYSRMCLFLFLFVIAHHFTHCNATASICDLAVSNECVKMREERATAYYYDRKRSGIWHSHDKENFFVYISSLFFRYGCRSQSKTSRRGNA